MTLCQFGTYTLACGSLVRCIIGESYYQCLINFDKRQCHYCRNDTSMHCDTCARIATKVSRYASRCHKRRITICQRMYRDTRGDVILIADNVWPTIVLISTCFRVFGHGVLI